ncbi:MAG: hypothetical protein KF842_14445 [Caulobacter sp.]|nr:hypothetical protein [Caulobacter sp.]
MKRVAGLAAAAIALVLGGQAFAADYYLTVASERQIAMVELSSITPKGATVTAAITRVFRDVVPFAGTPGFRYMVYTNEYDCERAQARSIEAQAFDSDHAVIYTLSNPPNEWRAVEPGTSGGDIMDAVCRPSTRDPDMIVEAEQTDLVDMIIRVGFDGIYERGK